MLNETSSPQGETKYTETPSGGGDLDYSQTISNQNLNTLDNQIDINLSTGNAVDLSKQRHFLAAFFFSFFLGLFGVDRFYLGKYWTGMLKLLTFGGLGVWATIDLSLIISGSMRDKQGNRLIDADKYKKFAKRTVFITTLMIVLLVVAIMAVSVYYVMQFIQNGGIEQITQQIYGTSNGIQSIDVNQIQQLLEDLSH